MTHERICRLALVAALGTAATTASQRADAALVASLATAVAKVAIVSESRGDPIIAEALARLRSELGVVGLDSEVMGCDGDGARDVRGCSDSASDGPLAKPSSEDRSKEAKAATAIIALAREDGVVTIEVIERLANGSKFFRLVYVPARDGGGDPSVLAVRAVELLRDVRLDVERTEAAPSAVAIPVPHAVVASVTPAQPPGSGAWRIAGLATLLQGRSGLGPAFAPALGVTRRLGERLSAMALAAGPFSRELHLNSTEWAATRQEVAMVGARVELGSGPLRPFAAVMVGILHLTAEGHSSDASGATGSPSMWSPVVTAGVGAKLGLARFVDLLAEVDLLAAGPAGRVTIRGIGVGIAGGPSILCQAGLSVALP